jgi:hypothetical protein
MSAVVSAVTRVAKTVANVIQQVGSITVKIVSKVADSVAKVGNTIGKIAESIAKDPLPTLITYAAQSVGIPAPLTAAAIAASRGKNIKEIATTAAAVYAGGQVARVAAANVPSFSSLSPATQKIIQQAVGGGLGSATVTAISGQPLDQILKSAAAGTISSAVQTKLSQLTNAQGQPLFKPGELDTQMINNATAQATLAVLNGKSIQTALENAAATTIASYGLGKVTQAVKSAYDNLVKNSNQLDALITNKERISSQIESTAQRYSSQIQEAQKTYQNYESQIARLDKANENYLSYKSQYDAAVQEIQRIQNNPRGFDEAFYLESNPDVAQNWGGSAESHYQQNGQYEGRQPNSDYRDAQRLANRAQGLADNANKMAVLVDDLTKSINTISQQYQARVNAANQTKATYESQINSLNNIANQINVQTDKVQQVTASLDKSAKDLDAAGQAAIAKDIDKAVNIATKDVKDRVLADRIVEEERVAEQTRISEETRALAGRYTQLDPASQQAYNDMIDDGLPAAQAMNQVEDVIKQFNEQQQQQAAASGATEWVDNQGIKNILIKGVGGTVVEPEIQAPPAPVEPTTFLDKLKNIGGLLGLGTSDPNAVKEALLGAGATGGQYQFGIFGFDSPQKKQEAIFEIDQILELLPSGQQTVAEDIKKALEAQPVTPEKKAGEPGGGGGGGTGAEAPETAPPAAGPETPQPPQLPLTPEVPQPAAPTGPSTVTDQDIITQIMLEQLAEEERRRQQSTQTSTGTATTPQPEQPLGPSTPQPDTTGQQVGPSQPQAPETPQPPSGGGEVSAPGGVGDSDKAILDLISGEDGAGEGGVGGTDGFGFGAGTGAGEGEGKDLGEGAGTGGGIGTGTGTGEGSGSGPGEGTGSGEILTSPRLVTVGGSRGGVISRSRSLPQGEALLGALLGTGLTSGGTGAPILGEDESKRRLVWNVESLRNALGI